MKTNEVKKERKKKPTELKAPKQTGAMLVSNQNISIKSKPGVRYVQRVEGNFIKRKCILTFPLLHTADMHGKNLNTSSQCCLVFTSH